MDLNNIQDIETLREICKVFMLQMKKDYVVSDVYGEKPDLTFKKDHWYFFVETEFGVDLYMDEHEPHNGWTTDEAYASFTYREIKEVCYCEGKTCNI